MKRFILCLMMLCFVGYNTFAQQDVSKMTKEDIMQLSYDDLLAMPFEDLLVLANKLGVSTDELFAMIMNKSVSSASKKEEDSFKSPLASTVITKAEIRSYGISSIEEALRLIPGMIVQEKSNGMYDVHIRGLNNIPDNQMMLYTENSNILLMIDGRIAHNYATGNLNFDILPIGIEDIDRIEVVRGANAALYGPNAVMGVINIITEKPNENSKLLQGSFHMGTQENYIGDIAYRQKIGKKLNIGLTANLQYRRRSTNELYVYPTKGLYYSKLSLPVLAYLQQDGGIDHTTMAGLLGAVGVDESGNIIYDPTKAKLIDASKGGYYSTTDINNLKQAFTFGAVAEKLPDYVIEDIRKLQMQKYGITYEATEQTSAQFLNGLANNMNYVLYNTLEEQGDISEMFDDPGMSRKTYGFNAYLNYRLSDDINFDFSAGYQQSTAGATPIGEIPFLLCQRVSKTGYINMNSNIYNLRLNANYMGGVQDYQKGKPGFKVFMNNVQLNAEYDINVGDLTIVPGLAYNHVWQTDYIPDYTNPSDPTDYTWTYHDHDYVSPNARHLSGAQGGKDAKLVNFAPSLRLDYKLGDFRAIGAVRFDKTNIPDEWNTSYQVGANYSINDNNLIRASYSTAMRSANIINASAEYTWHRDGLMPPDTIYFMGNEDAPLTKIRNAEIGYRWRPTDKILIDAEAYYSVSEDFGALKADKSSVIMPSEKLSAFMSNPDVLKSLRSITEGELDMNALTTFMGNSSVITTIKYGELPYKVKQFGFGINIDWIISSKLIAKLNANVQQTKIDNYYAYNQSSEILGQLGQIFGMITKVPNLAEDLQTDAITELMTSGAFSEEQLMKVLGVQIGENGEQIPVGIDFESEDFKTYFDTYKKYLNRAMGNIDQSKVAEISAGYAAAEDKEKYLQDLKSSDDNTEYAAYYALRYGVYNDNGTFYFGDSKPYTLPTKDGHTHKATPSVYGMIGLIYKPTPKIDITAYGNYIGERTYLTKYGSEKLKDRFTLSMKVGYKPVDGMEVFLTGHNLLNTKQQEFPYGDKIGGIYSVGLNFAF